MKGVARVHTDVVSELGYRSHEEDGQSLVHSQKSATNTHLLTARKTSGRSSLSLACSCGAYRTSMYLHDSNKHNEGMSSCICKRPARHIYSSGAL